LEARAASTMTSSWPIDRRVFLIDHDEIIASAPKISVAWWFAS